MTCEVSRQQNVLSHMKRIMRHPAVYSLHDRVGFAANGYRASQARLRKSLQSLRKS
jgi:hypothetical protein